MSRVSGVVVVVVVGNGFSGSVNVCRTFCSAPDLLIECLNGVLSIHGVPINSLKLISLPICSV